MSTLYLASDHAGVAMKVMLRDHLAQHWADWRVEDLGTHDAASVDYPDYGRAAAQAVVTNPGSMGIIICGSGVGISIAANRIAGARAALCTSAQMAALAREHNDANLLALGARLIGDAVATACVDAFLSTAFAGGRHQRRVEMLG